MGNQAPSTPKKRLNYLKNNPQRSQALSQNKSFESVPQTNYQTPSKITKSLSPIGNNLPTNNPKYNENSSSSQIRKKLFSELKKV